MKVVIPAAGIGTRLRPHTHTLPKSLLNVAGKPILGHILDRVAELEVSEVIFVVGFFGNMIKKYVNENYNLNATFVEQEELKGLGYAIHLCGEYFNDESVLIILGDTIYRADLNAVIKDSENSIGTHKVDDPRRFGVAVVKDGYITELVEKPDEPVSNEALVGIYYIKDIQSLTRSLAEIVDKGIKTRGEYQLTDALQIMLKNGARIKTFDVPGWFDCGKPETLLSTNKHLLSKLENSRPDIPGTVIIPPVFVGRGVKVENSIIGPNVTIAGDTVIQNSIIRDSIIGKGSVVKDCMMEDSLIGEYAQVRMQFRSFNVGDSSEIGYR
ncbi:MAG: NTP transferase domain-containing protein [candidate division Zixibacteria bacterium]|nr:NTP transferase domain-containing protein [candidate division Zixibacteria bacterium]